MTLLLHLIRTFFVLLIMALGTSLAVASQEDWSRVEYGLASQHLIAQSPDIAFTARAPPQTGTNVTIKGASPARTGYERVLYDTANLGELSAFSRSSIATNNGPDLTKFSTQDRKSYNTLERRIVEHEQKLADFKANPTVRPGMENQPLDVIRTAQERRVLHLEREIAAFRKNQSDIVSNYE